MLDSSDNGMRDDADADADCDPTPQPAVLGLASNENTDQADRTPFPRHGSQCTAALDDNRRQASDLAVLLELDPHFVPCFVFRLTCTEAGRKALQYRDVKVHAVRAACADRIQRAVADSRAGKDLAGTTTADLIGRAVEIAQGRPDAGSHMVNIGDVVAALCEKARVDLTLGGLMQGLTLPTVAEQVSAETERIGAILEAAVQDRIDQAEKAIIEAVTPPRRGGLTPIKLAAGIVVLCGVAGLAFYWASGLPGIQHAFAAIGLAA